MDVEHDPITSPHKNGEKIIEPNSIPRTST